MPLDSVFLSGLKKELAPQILGARIDKVQQPERDLLLLSLRTHDGNVRLLVHGGVGSARVCAPPAGSRDCAEADRSQPRNGSIATFKKCKEKDEINFNILLYLTQ